MTELNEKQLNEVAGGSKREITITVVVKYGEFHFDGSVNIKPYLDGELLSSQMKTLDSSISETTFDIKGIKGTARLDVKFNDEFRKSYDVNFDSSSYIELQ